MRFRRDNVETKNVLSPPVEMAWESGWREGRGGAVFGGFAVRGAGKGQKGQERAFLGEMGCFARVLANKGPVKIEKTGVEIGKTGVGAVIPGGFTAKSGGFRAATGVGAALTPVGAAAPVSEAFRQESEALRQVSRRLGWPK